jgi:hypothetical protein
MTRSLPVGFTRGARAALVPATLLLVVALSTGCGSDKNVLAQVGDETITTADFLDVARGNEGRYPGPPDSARIALLDDLVKRALLVQEARRRKLVPDSTIAPGQRATEEQLLLTALSDRMAPRAVEVSDAELETLYVWRGRESHAQVVYTLDRALADAARADLDRGVPFEVVADRYNPAGMVPPGGDLGFQPPGAVVNPLDDLMRNAPIGQVQGPAGSPSGGWFIVKVLERKRRAQEPFATQKPLLRQMLEQRKQRETLTRAYDDLRKSYDVRNEPGGAAAMFQRYNTRPDSLRSGMFANPPAPTREQAAQVLARYKDEKGRPQVYTLGDAVADLQSGTSQAPNMSQMPAIEQWVQSQVLRRVAILEARRRGLDREPELVRRVRQRGNNAFLEAIYNAEVAGKAKATPADVQKMYAERSEMFTRLENVRVLAAMLGDSATAVRVLDAGARAKSLRDAAKAVAPGVTVTDRKVNFPTEDQTWNMLRASLLRMAPGAYGGPYRMGDRWLVIQLLEKDQGPQSFEALPPAVRQALENAATEQARERRLAELTEELRRKLKPRIHLDRLARVPWPVAPAPGTPSVTPIPAG